MKKACLLLAVLFAILCFAGCSSSQASEEDTSDKTVALGETNPVATFKLEDGRSFTVELYYSVAPNTVKNFISLAKSGFYDGLTFHRIIAGFIIQGGDPNGNSTGGPGYVIPGEFSQNGFKNNLSHTTGVISMAKLSGAVNSSGSQFFICLSDNYTNTLDGGYAAFGKVKDGLDVVLALGNSKVIGQTPVTPIVIKSITVDTFGANYGEPETIK